MTCKIACLLLYNQFLNIKNKAQVYQFRLVMDNRLMRYPQEKRIDFNEIYIRKMKNILVCLILLMLFGCSKGNKKQIQVYTAIYELSVNKASDGYTNKTSKSSGVWF